MTQSTCDRKLIHIFVLIMMAWTLTGALASANPVEAEHVTVELVSDVQTIQAGQPFTVALYFEIDPHWHLYWINPGDSGMPPMVEWNLPSGFTVSELQFPYPKQIDQPPLASYGYEETLTLLTQITPPAELARTDSVQISVRVDWLVCKVECLPGNATLTLDFAVTAKAPGSNPIWAEAISAARNDLPITATEWTFSAALNDSSLQIEATPPAWFDGPLAEMQFFPESAELIVHAAPQHLRPTENGYQLSLKRSSLSSSPPDTIRGLLVSETGWRGPGSEKAFQVAIPVQDTLLASSPVSPATTSTGLNNLALALLFAFAGGMILNLMPCVLPVLSLKVFGITKHAGQDRRQSFYHGLIFMLGVLITFWVLAGLLIALQAGGEQLGWGFQLQSPIFLIILISLLFLFGLNLFGVFEVGTSLTGIGATAGSRSGWTGSFVSGITATVVATPCTAPFMGSALGFALTQPAWAALLIFTFLGLGMAAPYVLLSAMPSLLRFVPKPGRWMESFKQFMGFLMMATVVWLIWVLGMQAGSQAVAGLLVGLLFLSLGAWIWGRWGGHDLALRSRIVVTALALLFVAGGLAFSLSVLNIGGISPRLAEAENTQKGMTWQPFSPERVAELRADGTPVFIDFTAAWCLSCQVNKRVALDTPQVQQRFQELGIVPIKADWTSRDDTITQALAKFGRNSVPLYVFYDGKKESEPVILPEILTPGIVLEAISHVQE